MRKKIITIAGKPGSGKSTTSKELAKLLGYKHFSSGDLFRDIAKKRGIDINEINTLAESEKTIDHEVDERLKIMAKEYDELVIDSRMAWHWMPSSFKVYLDLDLLDASKRILNGVDPERKSIEKIPNDPFEYHKILQDRLASEVKRYSDLYQANPYDVANYNLVVDTLTHNPKEVSDLVLAEYEKWLNKKC